MEQHLVIRRLILLAFFAIVAFLLYIYIGDIIYSVSLLATKKYYSQFSFMSLMPFSSRRANIIAQGVYIGINFNTIIEIVKQNLLALDLELVIVLLALAVLNKFQLESAQIEKSFKMPSDFALRFTTYYLYTYVAATLAITIVVINNLIPLHGIDFYCYWFGLITLISTLLKFLFFVPVAYLMFMLILKKTRIKIQEGY